MNPNYGEAVVGKTPEPTLISETCDRLAQLSDDLRQGNARIEGFANRVLGPVSPDTCGGAGAEPKSPTSIAALTSLLSSLEREVRRLHDAAARVEKIG